MGLAPLHAKAHVYSFHEQQEEENAVGKVLLWMDTYKRGFLLETFRWALVHLLAPFVHILRSGYEMSNYVSRCVDSGELDDGSTMAYLQMQCAECGLTGKLVKAIVVVEGEIQMVHSAQLLSVLDEVVYEHSISPPNSLHDKCVKRLMRLQFVLRHITEMDDDHFNVYTAAWLNPSIYGSRALITAVAQGFSTAVLVAKMRVGRTSIVCFPPTDAWLIVIFLVWLVSNIPSYLLPNTPSRNALLIYLFWKEHRRRRSIFILLDIMNQMIVLIMPIMATLLMMRSGGPMGIIMNSLQVLFINGLDDYAFSTGEKTYIQSSVRDVVEQFIVNMDSYALPRSLRHMAWLPLVEMGVGVVMSIFAVVVLL